MISVISRLEPFAVAPRWLFVRIETSDGLVGWGEASLEGNLPAVRAHVTQLGEYLVGKDPGRIEDHYQVMSKAGFYRGGPVMASAVAGIDQALWDIAGKRFGVPVYQLLGGPVRDKVRIYGWAGGDEPTEVGDAVAAQREAGMTAIKMNAAGRVDPLPSAQDLVEAAQRVQAAREALGPTGGIGIDLHGRFTLPGAKRYADAVASFAPMFLEEPVPPQHQGLLGYMVGCTTIPIATGERLYTKEEFVPVLGCGVGIVQPDLAHAGGISEVRRIAAVADAHGALLAPHCPLGPIALAACLQVDFATPNFLIQEQSIGIHYNKGAEVLDYLADTAPLAFTDGHIARWDAPGLGIEMDEAAVRRADATYEPWLTPLWRHGDGSLAEW